MFNGTTASDITSLTFKASAPLMSSPSLPVKLVDPRCMPQRAHITDAGADLISAIDATIYPNEMHTIDTGVSVKVPVGHVGLVYSRSGQGKLRIHLANSVGVIDEAYRGNIKVMIVNEGDNPYIIKAFETKVAQLVITPIMLPVFRESTETEEEWKNTIRGTNGFGSTG